MKLPKALGKKRVLLPLAALLGGLGVPYVEQAVNIGVAVVQAAK